MSRLISGLLPARETRLLPPMPAAKASGTASGPPLDELAVGKAVPLSPRYSCGSQSPQAFTQRHGQAVTFQVLGAPVPIAFDDLVNSDPDYACELQAQRRVACGLEDPEVATFLNGVEFVSLGCFCGVAQSLQWLGLRKRSYPFDWVRCPAAGVVQCLEKRFRDFMKCSEVLSVGDYKVYCCEAWGGSFWHHDPSDSKAVSDMLRRSQRFLRLGTGKESKSPIFIRALNSTSELEVIPRLHHTLQSMFPDSTVRLIVIVDMQSVEGVIRVSSSHENDILLYRVKKDIWWPDGQQSADVRATMRKAAAKYGDAIASATKLWANDDTTTWECLATSNIDGLAAFLTDFDAGDPLRESFAPRLIQCQEELASEASDGEVEVLSHRSSGSETRGCILSCW